MVRKLLWHVAGYCTQGSAVLLIACFAMSTFARQTSFPTAWQQRIFRHAFSSGQRTYPAISNGYLVSFRTVIHEGYAANAIHLNSLASGEESQLPFWLADASIIWIGDAVVTQQGQVLVAGSFLHVPEGKLHNFISILDVTGIVLNTLDMGQYEPARLCSSNDGTIWTLGQDWDAESDNVSYAMLRNYSLNGELLRSYLQRKTVAVRTLALSRRLHATGAPGNTFLRCADGSVGAYIGTVLGWVEIRLPDGAARIWQTRLPASPTATLVLDGLALLGPNEVYASFRAYNTPRSDPPAAIRPLGLYKLNFGEGSLATWETYTDRLTQSSGSLSIGWLVGSDGASLVTTARKAKTADGTPILFWSKP